MPDDFDRYPGRASPDRRAWLAPSAPPVLVRLWAPERSPCASAAAPSSRAACRSRPVPRAPATRLRQRVESVSPLASRHRRRFLGLRGQPRLSPVLLFQHWREALFRQSWVTLDVMLVSSDLDPRLPFADTHN